MLPFLLTLRRIVRGIWRGLRDPEFQVLFSFAFLTVLSGTLFYTRFEAMRWLDALYFSVITLTTIGYGDFAPSDRYRQNFHNRICVNGGRHYGRFHHKSI